jgi:hypothetical protein
LGPRYQDLPSHRWHGVTYDVQSKDSQTLLTEVITLKKDGVFPLFYETITGKVLPKTELKVQIKDILPYVVGVTHEYGLATGNPSQIYLLTLDFFMKGASLHPRLRVTGGSSKAPEQLEKKDLKVLAQFVQDRSSKNTFVGKRIVDENRTEEETRAQLSTHLIYRVFQDRMATPRCSKRLELPEELPIALLFFYMSSVVRYKPEFLSRLQDSKFWPMLLSARVHSLYGFVLAFWSFMHQQNYFVRTQ